MQKTIPNPTDPKRISFSFANQAKPETDNTENPALVLRHRQNSVRHRNKEWENERLNEGVADRGDWGADYTLRRMALIKIPKITFCSTRPIQRINTLFDQTMKGGKRPIRHPRHQAMFQWVDMHIIHMCRKILLVAD